LLRLARPDAFHQRGNCRRLIARGAVRTLQFKFHARGLFVGLQGRARRF
jgi:hypothetical protein